MDYIHKQKLKYIIHQRVIPSAVILALLAGLPGLAQEEPGLFQPELVYATSATDIRDEAQSNLDDITNQLGGLEQGQDAVNQELEAVTEQLTQLLTEQQLLEDEMEYLQGEIDQANLDLDEARKMEAEQYEAMKLRIQFMYENSTGDSIWQAIIGASGIIDMLNRIEYVNQVYNTDRDMLEAYQETVARIEALTEELNRQMADMKILQDSYEEQKIALEATMDTLQSMAADYAQRIADAQAKAAELAQTIAKQNEIIREEERKRREEEARRQKEAEAAAALEAQRQKESEAADEARRQSEAADEARRQSEAAANSQQEQTENVPDGTQGSEIEPLPTEAESPSAEEPPAAESKDPATTSGVSGEEIVQYARQFVGNRYVWGGNSLTNGCDCSGFVNQVYGHFGISVPRYSMSFVNVGNEVTQDSLRPGDIVVYKPKAGIGHVAIYAGNGLIVEAQSTTAGITDNRPVDCREIVAIRRVL